MSLLSVFPSPIGPSGVETTAQDRRKGRARNMRWKNGTTLPLTLPQVSILKARPSLGKREVEGVGVAGEREI